MGIEETLNNIKNGNIVLVYDFDDREKETDMMIASEFVTHETIRHMRKDAGGLICTITPYEVASKLDLPFLSDVFYDSSDKYPIFKAMSPNDIKYDTTKSSFGITINHRSTYTGITDKDRAFTITEYVKTIFSDKSDEEKKKELGAGFRSPGHLHLLNSSKEILKDRRGHTELCAALTDMAGVKRSATICEMMGDDGNALSKSEAKDYAKKRGLSFIEGKEIKEAWERR